MVGGAMRRANSKQWTAGFRRCAAVASPLTTDDYGAKTGANGIHDEAPHGTLAVHSMDDGGRRGGKQMKRLQVGDTVQDFTLPTSMGKPVALSEALRSGPVVLAWYLFDFGRV